MKNMPVNMSTSVKKQSGLSLLGWLIVICIFGFVLMTIAKLGPHYLDNRYVVEVLKTLGEDPKFPTMTTSEIKSQIEKSFQINNVRGKPRNSVKIFKNNRGTFVTVQYEERIDFFHNIDVLLDFHSVLDSNKPDECCAPDPSLENDNS